MKVNVKINNVPDYATKGFIVARVDDVLKILHKYGRYIFVTDEKRYSSMVDEIANLKALEQEPCEDDYIKVPKKALKYKGEGIVAYNYEWLKEHFDIERKAILGDSEPCDAISREEAIDACNQSVNILEAIDRIKDLPPVYPKAKVGKWEIVDNMWWVCDQCFCKTRMMKKYNIPNYCPACGAKMEGVQE